MIAQTLMNQLENSNVLFNVREESLVTGSGLVIPNKKVLVNEHNEQPIGIVSNNYRTVLNEEIFSKFTKAIETSNINTDGAEIKVKFSKAGARTMVDFRFPNELIEVNGDVTALSITALNSFDGSTRYITKAGGLRMKCLNGQVLGKVAGAYSSFHNQSLDVDQGAKQIMEMLKTFQSSKEYWGKLMTRKVNPNQVLYIFGEFLGLDLTDEANLKKPTVNQLQTLWYSYSKELGNNVYAVYNCLTDYVTHRKYNDNAAAQSYLRGQSRIEQVMQYNPLFSEAEA
jgi:hypothetical protein